MTVAGLRDAEPLTASQGAAVSTASTAVYDLGDGHGHGRGHGDVVHVVVHRVDGHH